MWRPTKKKSFAITKTPDGSDEVPTEPVEPLPPPESSASRGVLGEVLEAFNEISYDFNGLAKAFNAFGNVIETEADNLGTQIKTSVNDIKIDIDNVVSKFGNIGKNLAVNLEI